MDGMVDGEEVMVDGEADMVDTVDGEAVMVDTVDGEAAMADGEVVIGVEKETLLWTQIWEKMLRNMVSNLNR